MRKFIASFLAIAMLAIALPLAASAQTSKRYNKNRSYKTYKQKEDKNIYDKHRNVINIGIGAGAGAIIGGLLGGKKGALIGAGVGAGGAAVYSYGINPKDDKKKKYRRYRRP
jgi:outer membrane lipoprotein SlyB